MKRSILVITSIGIATVLAGCGISQPNNNTSDANTLPVNSTTATTNTTAKKSIPKPVKLTKNNWINIHMVNDSVGWGVIYSTNQGAAIVHTTDGGKSWYDVSPKGTSIDTPNGVDYINGKTAWITIQPVSQSSNTYKPYLMLYHTKDGGQTWSSTKISYSSQIPVYQTEISVINSSIIYMDVIPQHGMNSMPGQLMVSHNDGATWSTVKTPRFLQLGGAVQFLSRTDGWLSTSNSTTGNYQLYETTNGGKAWSAEHVPIPSQYTGDAASLSLPQFSETNPNNGTMQANFQGQGSVIEHRGIYSTNNAGKSWSFVGEISGQAGLVSFPSTAVGVAIPLSSTKTFPTLYETTNSGKSWVHFSLSQSPFSTLLQNYTPSQLDFVSKDVGWVVWGPRRGGAATNQVWETKNGGHTWMKVWS